MIRLKKGFKKKISKMSTDNIDKFLDHGIDIDNRTIHLFEDIDADTAGMVQKGIQLMVSKNKDNDINIYINSFGGCPYASIGLYSFIRTLKSLNVNTYNVGCAMSGGSIIFLAGDNRYMYEDTVFMVHSVSSQAEGKVYLDLVEEAEECKRIHKNLCRIYAENTNLSERQWDNKIKYKNMYFRSDLALKMEFIKKVIIDNDDI